MSSSTAVRTPLSKARASAAVWNVSPNFLSPVFQWWNVGITLLYSKSFLIIQLNTTWNNTKVDQTIIFIWFDVARWLMSITGYKTRKGYVSLSDVMQYDFSNGKML